MAHPLELEKPFQETDALQLHCTNRVPTYSTSGPGTPLLNLRQTSREKSTIMLKKRKTVSTLERDDCRWPVGDPRSADFHFCGAKALAGRPYCALHWHMAFLPARPRTTSHILPARRAAA